jgi:transcriptional regulator with XRE-family HTH domain
MITYLEQLETRCREAGLKLDEVCRYGGIASTTLARWRKGETSCRQAPAEPLFGVIDELISVRVQPSSHASVNEPSTAEGGEE